MITRKAILLKHSENDLEDYRTNLDCGLIKYFLKSGPGGCFEDNEIVEIKTREINNKEELFALIDSVEYCFIYYSGHAVFFDRKIHLPIKDMLLSASELERKNKKQWLFFDCCRTDRVGLQSPEFYFNRKDIVFPNKSANTKDLWYRDMESRPNFYITYFVTEMGQNAFVNERGGYGTQLFFSTLSQLLLNNNSIDLTGLVDKLKERRDLLQKPALIGWETNNIIFRN